MPESSAIGLGGKRRNARENVVCGAVVIDCGAGMTLANAGPRPQTTFGTERALLPAERLLYELQSCSQSQIESHVSLNVRVSVLSPVQGERLSQCHSQCQRWSHC